MKMTMEHLEDKLTRISLDGRLDLEGTRAIDQQFAFATSTQPLKLAVDLSSVSFIASIGLRTLLTAARAQAGRGGRMVLVAPNEMVRKVLETSGIDSIVPILTTGLPTWVNAGHPGPALARGSSEFRFLEGAHGVLLGIDPAAAYTVGETGLPPGSAMLLYTDET